VFLSFGSGQAVCHLALGLLVMWCGRGNLCPVADCQAVQSGAAVLDNKYAMLFGAAPAGMYYLRTRAAADAIKFTVDQQALAINQPQAAAAAPQLMSPSRAQQQQQVVVVRQSPLKQQQPQPLVDDGMTMEEREAQLAKMICRLENKDACLMCGS